jgi:hypothetical protein
MGASGWHYFVPYQADIAAALAALRADVFAKKTYYGKRALEAKTIDDAVRLAAEEGTHSVLDIHRVVDTPHPPTSDALRYFARLGSVAPAVIEGRPTRAELEREVMTLCSSCGRGTAVWTIAYRDGVPHELLFAGKTGD